MFSNEPGFYYLVCFILFLFKSYRAGPHIWDGKKTLSAIQDSYQCVLPKKLQNIFQNKQVVYYLFVYYILLSKELRRSSDVEREEKTRYNIRLRYISCQNNYRLSNKNNQSFIIGFLLYFFVHRIKEQARYGEGRKYQILYRAPLGSCIKTINSTLYMLLLLLPITLDIHNQSQFQTEYVQWQQIV